MKTAVPLLLPSFIATRKKTFESHFIDKIDGKEKIRGIITTSSYEARAYGVKTAMPIAQALHSMPTDGRRPFQLSLFIT